MSSTVPGITCRVGSCQTVIPVPSVLPAADKDYRLPDGYPPVDPSIFIASADSTYTLVEQTARVIDRLRKKKELASAVMDAAQRGDKAEVTRLIRNIGVQSRLEVKFTPEGIQLIFDTESLEERCCELVVKMRWNPI